MSDMQVAANPFGMMINPEAFLEAMSRSDRLDRLHRRVYRPLDRPMIPKSGEVDADAAMSDAAIDSEIDQALALDAADGLADLIAVGRPLLVD